MPSKKPSKPLSAHDLGTDIVSSINSEFHTASDRAFAILGAAYMDTILEQLLRAIFVEDTEATERLLGISAPIGSNGARYNLAYSLALITKYERDDLKTIAEIRNYFAHSYHVVAFDSDDRARDLVLKMHFVKRRAMLQKDLASKAKIPAAAAGVANLKATPRELLRDAVIEFMISILPRVRDTRRVTAELWFAYPVASE